MEEVEVTMTAFKKALGDMVNRAAYGGAWIILTSRGRPKAALVSLADLEQLRRLHRGEEARHTSLQDLDALRERIRQRWEAAGLTPPDSATVLRETREERTDALAGMR